MKEKEKLLKTITEILNEHIRWKTVAEKGFNDIEVCDKTVPVDHSECKCGKFINEYEYILKKLISFQALSKDHKEFHKIYKMLYEFEKKNTKQQYLELFNKISDNIINDLKNLSSEIKNISD